MANNNRKRRVPVAVVLAAALYTVSFTSQAAAMIPEEETETAVVEMTVDVNGVSETALVNDSAEKISSTVESATKEGEKKAQQKKEEIEARKNAEELLASIIFCEAGNQPYAGKVAVGAVIMNRVESGRFPNTIQGVIYQRGQFTPAMTGKLARVLASGNIPSSCYDAARAALNGESPVGNALFFNTRSGSFKLGDHYFS